MEFHIEPTALELALWRALPLNGQLVEIAKYQRLCDRKYCGDALNATADWWYKCDAEGNRTTTGQYMRILDHRGVSVRPAGQNSKHTMASGAPYNGGSIGSYMGDAIQNITGSFSLVTRGSHGFWASALATSALYPGSEDLPEDKESFAVGSGWPYSNANMIIFDASRNVRTANETRVATISAFIGIKY
jgi:hypothetical protein